MSVRTGASISKRFDLTTTLTEYFISNEAGMVDLASQNVGLKVMNRTGAPVTITMHLCEIDPATGRHEIPTPANRVLNAFSIGANTTSPVDVSGAFNFSIHNGQKLFMSASAGSALSVWVMGTSFVG